MSRENLELIKSRTIFLKENEFSSDIVLVGDNDGDMFFKFRLYYSDNSKGAAQFDAKDEHHAMFMIATKPNAMTALVEPLEIGTYQGRILYIDINIEPCQVQGGPHRLTVNFLKSAE